MIGFLSAIRDRRRGHEAGRDDEAVGGHQGEGEGQDDGGTSREGREAASQIARTTNPGQLLFGQFSINFTRPVFT